MADKGLKISWKIKPLLEKWHCGTGTAWTRTTRDQESCRTGPDGGLHPAEEGRSLNPPPSLLPPLPHRPPSSPQTPPPTLEICHHSSQIFHKGSRAQFLLFPEHSDYSPLHKASLLRSACDRQNTAVHYTVKTHMPSSFLRHDGPDCAWLPFFFVR